MNNPSTERVEIDPRELLVDVNIRKDVRLDSDFVVSIKELGVLVPITAVRTASGEIRVRFGHRRTLGAIEAELPTVPVDVIGSEGEDDAAQIERIITQHAENVHRAGLTAVEKVEVVAQLSAFGVKASEIAKKTRIPKKEVAVAKAVGKSELAKQATDRYDFLTLEQAAAVAEFENNRDAVKVLVAAAQQGRFDHALEVLREDREEAKALKRFEAELTKQGVRVIDDDTYLERTVVPLTVLRRRNPSLTDKGHESCPGHAANLTVYRNDDEGPDSTQTGQGEWVLEVEYVCMDPVAYGHVEAEGTAAEVNVPRDTSEQDRRDDEARKERQRVIANNKAWRAAENVRREWLKNFLNRKIAPKGTAAYLAGELLSGRFASRNGYDRPKLAIELLGNDTPDGSTDGRSLIVALAVILGGYETATSERAWRDSWAAERTAPYLSRLAEWGYELSEIEQSVVDQLTPDDAEEDVDQ
jgi:ParB family chromosome partitioning protein